MSGFDFELEQVVKAIGDTEARHVLLQFPEGLKRQAGQVVEALSGMTDALLVVSGEPCFGACDLPSGSADMVVHFGHLPIPSLESHNRVLFIQARSDADPVPALEKHLASIPSRVGLLTTAQHVQVLERMAEFLDSRGIKAVIGRGDKRVYAAGQVLGCNASAARSVERMVDGFLFIGTGSFHPLAVALVTDRQVLALDPVTGRIADMAPLRDRMLRQRHAAITAASDARRWGVLLSSKPGQRRSRLAVSMLDMLRRHGRMAVLVEMDLVTPQKLDSLGMDAWVSTACPRLAMDDFARFRSPVLTPVELEIVLGQRSWEEYSADEITGEG